MKRVVLTGMLLAVVGSVFLVGIPAKPKKTRTVKTAQPQASTPASKPVLVFIHIPEALMPTERGKKYEEPIDAVLKKAGVGSVTGSGTAMKKDGSIGYVGVDANLTDLKKGLPVLKAELTRIGAPKGTRLQYSVGETRVDVGYEEVE